MGATQQILISTPSGVAYNPWTQDYLATFPSTTIDLDAVNTFEQTCIDNGWDSKIICGYLLWGGATEQEYNFQTNATFNATSGGGISFPNGAKGDGINGYFDTNFNPSTHSLLDDTSIYVYNATEGSQVAYDIGCYDGTHYYAFILLFSGTSTRSIINSSNIATIANTTTKGGIGFRRVDASNTKMYKGSSLFDTQAVASTTRPNSTINLFCLNLSGTRSLFSDREFRGCFIFEGMSDADMTGFDTAYETLQTTLGRNV